MVTQTADLMVALRNDLFLYGEGLNHQERFTMLRVYESVNRLLDNPQSEADARVLAEDTGWEALRRMFNISTYTKYEVEDTMPNAERNIAMFGLLKQIQDIANRLNPQA